MDNQSNASKMREKTTGNLGVGASGVSCDGSPRTSNSSPLISRNTTINMPRGLYNVDVAATFGVSLTTVGDLDVLIKDIEAGEHNELLSGMANDKRMALMDALGVICDSIQAENIAGESTKGQPKVNFNFRPLVADLVFDGVNISIPRKVVKKAGLEVILEGGPWMIRNSPIILKKWSMDNRLLKEELTRIPIWFKLHDGPTQGRSSFVRCLIEVNSKADLVDAVTIGIPSLTEDGFTKETIHVVSPPIVTTFNVVTPTVEKTNDEFQMVGKKKKRKGKYKSTNGGQFAGPSVKQNVRYEPKATTSAPKKEATNVDNASKSSSMLKTAGNFPTKDNITTSNSYSVLNDEEEDEEEHVENVYDESANLFPNTKLVKVYLSRLLLMIPQSFCITQCVDDLFLESHIGIQGPHLDEIIKLAPLRISSRRRGFFFHVRFKTETTKMDYEKGTPRTVVMF
ncbi:zinc knuckle CX2CX4HX4C containing protein [Tanacetum coccineum]